MTLFVEKLLDMVDKNKCIAAKHNCVDVGLDFTDTSQAILYETSCRSNYISEASDNDVNASPTSTKLCYGAMPLSTYPPTPITSFPPLLSPPRSLTGLTFCCPPLFGNWLWWRNTVGDLKVHCVSSPWSRWFFFVVSPSYQLGCTCRKIALSAQQVEEIVINSLENVTTEGMPHTEFKVKARTLNMVYFA